ncbi:glycosyltransferase family 9 protein [Pseudonocardia sp. DSM 110487]|uniref:glycosyltransferase family 9 protein n=1 Tax=Pseudonocardia sp. DSM 110487 TaxID=2865833 RepID=UPI001C69B787|nr:glycosyltransferase family 9 protein [Pseudonocardia sp. DSM 110487]QYN31898.1 glycosyltransferase family 9 protein [Pseudonocardia sp. DSM 110487]
MAVTAGPGTAVPGQHPGADRGGPVDLSTIRRVLVVRADNIGDVVTTTPALRALRAAAPDAAIDLLASPAGSAVVPMIPELDGVLVTSASWQQLPGASAADEHAERALLERVAVAGYDVLLVFTSFSQSPWPVAHLGLLAGIGTRVAHSREFGGAVATHWVTPPPDATHQVDRALHLLAAVGVPHRGRETALSVPAAARRDAAALAPGRPFAVLAPGASCAARRYPAQRFGAAAAEIARAGLPVLVAGSEPETPLVARVAAAAGQPDVTPVPPVPLPVFTALIARAAVAVTNNSGGMHLADAVRTPVAVTYAGTERPEELRPRGTRATLLGRPVPCSPCRQLTCPFQHECLDVPPGEVAAAALALAGPRPERGSDFTEEIPCLVPVKP